MRTVNQGSLTGARPQATTTSQPAAPTLAVIGTGLGGLAAAWLLRQRFQVTLFEQHPRPGMGVFVVDYHSRGQTTRIDIPTRVFCDGYYPNLLALLRAVGVRLHATDHSAAYADADGEVFFHYGNLRAFGRSWSYPKGRRSLGREGRELMLATSAATRTIAPVTEEILKALVVVWMFRTHRIGFLVDGAIFGFAVGAGWLLEVQPGHLLVELLGEHLHPDLAGVLAFPERDLREGLVGEGVGHDEAGVAGGAAQVHQSSLGEHDDALAIGEDDVVHLRLDVLPIYPDVLISIWSLMFMSNAEEMEEPALIAFCQGNAAFYAALTNTPSVYKKLIEDMSSYDMFHTLARQTWLELLERMARHTHTQENSRQSRRLMEIVAQMWGDLGFKVRETKLLGSLDA